MLRSAFAAAAIAAILFVTGPAWAQRGNGQGNGHGHAQGHGGGHHHHHGGHGHGGYGYRGNYGGFYGNGLNLSFGFGVPFRSFYYSSGYPYYGGLGYGGYRYGSPYGYQNYYAPAYVPPMFEPFLDPLAGEADPHAGGVAAARPIEARPVEAPPAEARPAEPRPPAVRVSNLESRRRALRFVEAGDTLFREQRFHEALQKYKSAAEAAPDMVEPYMRQGYSLIATSRYELAAAAFKRGLAIEPEWAASTFKLASIYGGAEFTKNTHVENLVRALLEKPADADLIFVLAMFLQHDGDPDRAARFFQKAGEIAGAGAPHLRPYLSGEDARPAPAREAPRDKAPPAELPGVEA